MEPAPSAAALQAVLLLATLLAAGCPGHPTPEPDDDVTAGDDDSAAADDDSASDDDSAAADDDSAAADDDSAVADDDSAGDDDETPADDDDTTPVGPFVDCAALPWGSLSATVIGGAFGYHGLAFDAFGYEVGSDGFALMRSTYAGAWSVFHPSLGNAEQMDYLPSGDLVLATNDSHGLVRVTPAGAVYPVNASIWAYGVRIGPDGMVYAADQVSVYRIDPATGATEILAEPGPWDNWVPRVVDFSPALDRLYIGTNDYDSLGRVFYIDLDANLDPVGQVQVFASFVGEGWHDGLGVDACGNLYVADYWSSGLYRVSPSGGVTLLFDASWDPAMYGHGLQWGSGVGGWMDDALYVPQPYNGNTVGEVPIGAPYRTFTGTVLNAP